MSILIDRYKVPLKGKRF